jgi:hypothetical protein
LNRVQDCLKHAIGISKHVVIPESQDQVSHCFQEFGPISVALSVLIVLPTIDFHDELRIGAHEVDHVSIDWHLPLELETGKSTVTQAKPQHAFGIGLIAT